MKYLYVTIERILYTLGMRHFSMSNVPIPHAIQDPHAHIQFVENLYVI